MSDTYCALAWTSLCMNTHGAVRVCGRSKPNKKTPNLKNISIDKAWNSDYFKNIRLDMLAGRKNSNCEKCYIQERLDGYSKRLESNTNVKVSKTEALKMTQSDGSVAKAPEHIDIRVGNICNLKCIHCWTGNSSKWYEDTLLMDKYENTTNIQMDNSWISNKGTIWDYMLRNIKQIKKLSFLGGEAFASPYHNIFLDELIEKNHTDLHLYYVSNATLITEKIIKKLERFKKVRLGISLDAIEKRIEFMRFPTQWKSLEENLFYLNNSSLDCYINWTAYNTNIFTLPETYNYCLKQLPNISFELADFVKNPSHMSVQNLPSQFKTQVMEKLESLKIPHLKFYINYMVKENLWDTHNKTLLSYLDDLDKARGTNWKQSLPEISTLFN